VHLLALVVFLLFAEELEKNPRRPHLRSLKSAAEVKQWIPGIKREIDYCLDQISGARQHRYPDTKIKEFERKVEELEKEYKRFVNKVYELDPSTKVTGVPWQPRGYVSKRKMKGSMANEGKLKKICTPILDKECQDKGQGDATIENGSNTGDKNSIARSQEIEARDFSVASEANKDNPGISEIIIVKEDNMDSHRKGYVVQL